LFKFIFIKKTYINMNTTA